MIGRLDWNVVVTVHAGRYREALSILQRFGTVGKTDFFNVLVLRVERPLELLAELNATAREEPGLEDTLSRVVPVTVTFEFQNPVQFEAQAKAAVGQWLGEFVDRSFHVRMHRRGFRGRLSSQEEERFLDHFLIAELRQRGSETRVTFDDPDLILAVESVGQRAGMSLWTREQREIFPLLELD